MPGGLFGTKQGEQAVVSPVVGVGGLSAQWPPREPHRLPCPQSPSTFLPRPGRLEGSDHPCPPHVGSLGAAERGSALTPRGFAALWGLREKVWSSLKAAGRASWRGCPHRDNPPGRGTLSTSPDNSRTGRASNPKALPQTEGLADRWTDSKDWSRVRLGHQRARPRHGDRENGSMVEREVGGWGLGRWGDGEEVRGIGGIGRAWGGPLSSPQGRTAA